MVAEVKDKIERLEEEAVMSQLTRGIYMYACWCIGMSHNVVYRKLWQKKKSEGR